jgi:polyphosphate kinase
MSHPFIQNRDLSWLSFNQRVLEEAEDSRVPIFERCKYLSIYTNNLHEFFMIRGTWLCFTFLVRTWTTWLPCRH